MEETNPELIQEETISVPDETEVTNNTTATVYADLVYGLNDRPHITEALLVAFQHVMASFVGILTPPLIICNTLGLDATDTSFIISMSLFISGLATFIQAKRIGPIGSGLLSLQGTSFTFLGPILAIGTTHIEAGNTPQQALALIFGCCFFGAFVEVFFSRFLHLTKKIITPLVTGTVITIIGLTLIKVGMTSLAGGVAAKNNGTFGSPQNLALGGFVMVIIIILNLSSNKYLRMGAIFIGLMVGYIISIFLGLVNFEGINNLPLLSLPIPFRYGMGFEWSAFIPFILLYLITTIETIGDLTATSAVSQEPIAGNVYINRIKGGVLGDGINSLIAACFNTFPNTTFSQNNGVIQMTGVGSRYVGFYIAGILAFLGFIPVIGGFFQALPQPVLGGATIVIFGSIAVAGINIIASSEEIGRRSLIIVSVSLALGLGVTFVPEIFNDKPMIIKSLFSSGISTGGLVAILLNGLLPKDS
ncbi:MAG: nucleobase:cation symporter-2 family protein [Microcystaceae cyanobacterium]